MAGSPVRPQGSQTGEEKAGGWEKRQKRLKRLRLEKEDLQASLRESRRRVRQLEAARLIFDHPEGSPVRSAFALELSPVSELGASDGAADPQGSSGCRCF
eukprot:g25759.t1